MPSLAELPQLVGFFSYSREDDVAFRRALSALRDAIQRYLSAQLGCTSRDFRLWQDQEALAPGKMWELKITEAIEEAVFFIPIVTPRAVASKHCKFEFESFLTRERKLGRNDLVFPIHYILVPTLLDDEKSREDPVLSIVSRRQYVDWLKYFNTSVNTPAFGKAIARFSRKIAETLREPWISMEERRQPEAKATRLRSRDFPAPTQPELSTASNPDPDASISIKPPASRVEAYEKGRALPAKTPREAHAELHGPLDRDPVAILAEADAERVPELLPERYKRMVGDPFGFLCGASAVMATDLAHQPMAGAPAQACGDCHLMNFGAFCLPEGNGNILFDINDFDETMPGVDFTIDIKRLAASVAVAARAANISDRQARRVAASTVTDYREHMFALMEISPVQIWHNRIDLEHELKQIKNPSLRHGLSGIIRRARPDGLDGDDNFPQLTTGPDPRIADKAPTIFHIRPKTLGGRKIDFARTFKLYRETLSPDRGVLLDRYRLTDVAFKAVGVGSVGTICVVGLFLDDRSEPLFLQVKQAQRSVLERLSKKLAYQGPQGRRVVEGQRMMQAANDIFLGWTSDEPLGIEFYVRTLKNRQLGALSELAEQAGLLEYGRICGRTLARSHARTGDPAVIAGYMGRGDVFDDAVASFAMAYADQTAKDHALLQAKFHSARLG